MVGLSSRRDGFSLRGCNVGFAGPWWRRARGGPYQQAVLELRDDSQGSGFLRAIRATGYVLIPWNR